MKSTTLLWIVSPLVIALLHNLSFTLIKTYMIIYLYLLLHCSILEILLDHFVISSKSNKVYIKG